MVSRKGLMLAASLATGGESRGMTSSMCFLIFISQSQAGVALGPGCAA